LPFIPLLSEGRGAACLPSLSAGRGEVSFLHFNLPINSLFYLMQKNEEPVYFKSQSHFRKWLEKNHAKKDELWLGFYKVGSGKKGITPKQALDEALAFGWIDGIRKSIDEESYKNRYTPRRKGSVWSDINTKRVKELQKMGVMHEAGLKAFGQRKEHRAGLYSFEQPGIELPVEYEKKFIKNKKAWKYFNEQPPGYRRTSTWWVISAKKEETRLKRLDILIKDSASQTRIAMLKR
jgi:uncharacterized protein YdeI (YjbR/CyaY-like superfamily)